MAKSSRRFNSRKNANSFAKRVGGVVKDLREFENSISKFKVTYTKNKYRKMNELDNDRCLEEGRDFGYPNEYWQ